jgi:hypothetical protein
MLLAHAEESDAGPSLSEHDIVPDRTRTGLCLPILDIRPKIVRCLGLLLRHRTSANHSLCILRASFRWTVNENGQNGNKSNHRVVPLYDCSR